MPGISALATSTSDSPTDNDAGAEDKTVNPPYWR